jgi:ribonuclease HII
MLIIGEKLSIIAKRVREAMMKKIKARYRRLPRQWKEGAGIITRISVLLRTAART